MRVLVCGSRHFNDIDLLWKVLDEFADTNAIETVIHGDARGADRMAGRWANSRYQKDGSYIREWKFPADWNRLGKAAGSIRNRQMLVEGQPDHVIAFLAPNSRGTKNMIDQATKAGIPVTVVNIK